MSMARDTESKISTMGAWDFWARPYGIGLSDEDAAALKDGTANQDQLARAEFHAISAKNALIGAEAGHPFGKPS